jgi:hypothetical protein
MNQYRRYADPIGDAVPSLSLPALLLLYDEGPHERVLRQLVYNFRVYSLRTAGLTQSFDDEAAELTARLRADITISIYTVCAIQLLAAAAVEEHTTSRRKQVYCHNPRRGPPVWEVACVSSSVVRYVT